MEVSPAFETAAETVADAAAGTESAAPDPFLDALADPPEPRWWRRPAVAGSGIAIGVLAVVAVTFLVLPESPGQPDLTWRPALPAVAASSPASAGPPSPASARSSTPAATAAPAVSARAAVQRPTASVAGPVPTRSTRPATPPAARPSPSRTQASSRPNELAPLPPFWEHGLRSMSNDWPTAIDFVNTRSQQVVVYWLDHRGRRVRYRVLDAGQSYRQPTYVSHPWVVARTDGRALAIFLPDRNPARATIT